MGVKIRTMWMTPFYISFGLLFVYIFKSEINFEKMKAFTSLFLVLFLISPILYAYVSISKTDKRTDFNGKNLAIQAKDFYETALAKGFNVNQKEQIHNMTLRSWVKEQTEAGNSIPAVFGAWTGRRAKITRSK